MNASPRIADEPDHVAATDGAIVSSEPRVAGEMRVVEVVARVIHEPEPPAADSVPADREDRAVGDRDDRSPERSEEIVAVVPVAGNIRPLPAVRVAPVGGAATGKTYAPSSGGVPSAVRRSRACAGRRSSASSSAGASGSRRRGFGVVVVGRRRGGACRRAGAVVVVRAVVVTGRGRGRRRRRRRLRGGMVRGGVADQHERPRRQACVCAGQTELERGRPVAERLQPRQHRPAPDGQRRPVGDRRQWRRRRRRPRACPTRSVGDRRAQMPAGSVAAGGTRSARSDAPDRAPASTLHERVTACVPPGAVSGTPCTAGLGVREVDRVLGVVERRSGISAGRRRGNRRAERGRQRRIRLDDRNEACADARRRRDLGESPWGYDKRSNEGAKRRFANAPHAFMMPQPLRLMPHPFRGGRAYPRAEAARAPRPSRRRARRYHRAGAARPSARGVRARDPPACARPAVERALQLPRRAVQRRDRGVDAPLRTARASGRPASRSRSRRPRAAPRRSTRTSRRPRPGRSALRRRRRAARARRRAASRAGAAAGGGRGGSSSSSRREPVRRADARKMLADPRPFVLPRAHADVDVVALRKHPAVAAGNVRQLDDRASRVAVAFDDAVARRFPRARRRGRCRRRARAPSRSCRSRRPLRRRRPPPSARRRRGSRRRSSPAPLAHLHPALARRVEQERVEAPALRHPDHRARAPAARRRRRSGTAARRGRPAPRRPATGRPDSAASARVVMPAAARLVARERRLVDEQHRAPPSARRMRRRRPRRAAADDEHVEALHEREATMRALPGVCPSGQRERAVNPSAQPTEVRIRHRGARVVRVRETTRRAEFRPWSHSSIGEGPVALSRVWGVVTILTSVRRLIRPVWRNAPFWLGVVGFAVLAAQVEFGLGGAWLANVNNKYTYDAILVLAALNCFLCARGRTDRVVWIWVGVAISAWTAGDIYYTCVARREGRRPVPVALRRRLPPLLSAGLHRARRALPQGGARDRPEPVARRRHRGTDDRCARGERRVCGRRALARRKRRIGGGGRDQPRLPARRHARARDRRRRRRALRLAVLGEVARLRWRAAPCSPSATASTSSRSRRTPTRTARSSISAGRPGCC